MKRVWPHALGLCLLVALTVASNVAWVRADRTPPSDDDNGHLINILHASQEIAAAEGPLQKARTLMMWRYGYPPAGYYPAVLAYLCGGASIRNAVLTLNVYAALLIVACFAAGWWAGGPLGGWLGGLAAATCPQALYFSRLYFADMPVAAFVAAALAALFWSDGLRRTRWCAVAGCMAGCAMMTKPAALPMIVAPVAAMIAVALARRTARLRDTAIALAATGVIAAVALRIASWIGNANPMEMMGSIEFFGWLGAAVLVAVASALWRVGGTRVAGNLCVVAALTFAVSAPWYIGNIKAMQEKWRVQDAAFALGGFTEAGAGLMTYRDLVGMFWLAGPLMGIGLLWMAFRRRIPDVAWPCLLAMALLIAWCAKSGWADRYVLVGLPFVVVMATWWIGELHQVLRIPLATALALGWMWQSAGCWAVDRGMVRAEVPVFSRAGGAWRVPRVAPPPQREPFPLDDLMDLMARDGSGPKEVLIVNDHDRGLQARTLELFEQMRPRGLTLLWSQGPEPAWPPGAPSPESRHYAVAAAYNASQLDTWEGALKKQSKAPPRLLAEMPFPYQLRVRLYRL